MFWGLSSALDLCQEYINAFKIPDEPGTDDLDGQPTALNIFICGGADPRHIIKTLAKRYTHGFKPKLNIYVLDACEEITARNLLLLGLALEPPESFSLITKTHLFMDIYGNALMRPSSNYYVASKSRTLRNMICDKEELQRLAPMLNIDGLKYRERDTLELSFSYWQPHPQVYEIDRFWEQRVRALLGPRYDHRVGAFDWDLSMTLKSREGQQICSQEYRYFRDSGIAFVFPEYEHCKANKTLCAGLKRNGRSFLHRGYVGDIETGPFCGFGLRTSEERMHHSVHGDNDYRATDITERNLLEFFHELLTQTIYVHDKHISRRYGSTQLLMTPLLVHNEIESEHQTFDKPWIPVPDVQMHFISPTEMLEMQKSGPRWQNFFDIAFVGYNYYTFLNKEVFGIMRSPGLFILETKLLTVQRKEHLVKFETAAKELFKKAGLRPCINYQALNTHNMQLKYKKLPDGAGDAEDEFPDEPIKEQEREVNEMGDSVTDIQSEKIQDEQSNEEKDIALEEMKDDSNEEKAIELEEMTDESKEEKVIELKEITDESKEEKAILEKVIDEQSNEEKDIQIEEIKDEQSNEEKDIQLEEIKDELVDLDKNTNQMTEENCQSKSKDEQNPRI